MGGEAFRMKQSKNIEGKEFKEFLTSARHQIYDQYFRQKIKRQRKINEIGKYFKVLYCFTRGRKSLNDSLPVAE